MKIGVIVNPAAGGGRLKRLWPRIETALKQRLGGFELMETPGPSKTAGLAMKLIEGGAELLVAVGGDGTVSEVANGLIEARGEAAHEIGLAIVPVGTGSDLARGLGIDGDFDAIAAGIAERPGRRVDVGQLEFVGKDGQSVIRHFVNIASLGISADIATAANASRKLLLPGKVLFFWHSMREIARYSPYGIRVQVDGAVVFEGPSALVTLANNRFFGGGMMIAPDAEFDDGLLDVVVVQGAGRLALMRALGHVYGGTHRTLDLCAFHRGVEVEVEPLPGPDSGRLGLEADGEPCGFAPVRCRVLPRAITLRW
jgi:YegS/Rv2252/BmrU family lipid kinase